MKKILSNKQRRSRMFTKMVKSFGNKLNDCDKIWFNALKETQKYSLIHHFINYKTKCKELNIKIKVKHFLEENKSKYNPTLIALRNSKIKHLIK